MNLMRRKTNRYIRALNSLLNFALSFFTLIFELCLFCLFAVRDDDLIVPAVLFFSADGALSRYRARRALYVCSDSGCCCRLTEIRQYLPDVCGICLLHRSKLFQALFFIFYKRVSLTIRA